MNKRRLLKLAALLEADAKNKKGVKFDLRGWGKRAADDFTDVIPMDCGTKACAVGLACISGAFKRSGLTWCHGWGGFAPKFGGNSGWPAVEDFFSIKHEDGVFLFDSESYGISTGARAERAVAKRIRNFVAGITAPA